MRGQPVGELLDNHILDGARLAGRAAEFGAPEVGPSADSIPLAETALRLGYEGEPEDIDKAELLKTWLKAREMCSKIQ